MRPVLAAGVLLAVLGRPAFANTFCCNDDGGRRYCGIAVPVQCYGRAYHELDVRGAVKRVYEAPLTPEQQARREAELEKRKSEQRRIDEERRRDLALRASYSSEKDIDLKRDKMLAEAERSLKEAEDRRAATLEEKRQIDIEAEFYLTKPMPEALKRRQAHNGTDLAAVEPIIAARRKEIEAIRSRFEDEKKRWLELSGRRLQLPDSASRPR